MAASPEWNFAGRLVKRAGALSCLLDAASGETVEPGEVTQRIMAFAKGYRAAGLKPGDRILIGCALSPSSSLAYLGAMYAGLVAVPIEERMLGSSIEIYLESTGAKAVWMERGLPDSGICKRSVLNLKGGFAEVAGQSTPPEPCEKASLAAFMATSGSTGVPRFVLVSHENLISNTEAIIRSQRLSHDERVMLILPISYCFGASLLHTHLYVGGSVIYDRRFMFPDKVLQAVEHFRCTTFAGVPTVFHVLLRRASLPAKGVPSLRRFLQ